MWPYIGWSSSLTEVAAIGNEERGRSLDEKSPKLRVFHTSKMTELMTASTEQLNPIRLS